MPELITLSVLTHCLFGRHAWNLTPVFTDSQASMRFRQALSLEHKLLLFAPCNLVKDVCHLGDNVRKAELCHEVGYSEKEIPR